MSSFPDNITHNDTKPLPHQQNHPKGSFLQPNWQKAELHGKAVSVGFQDHSQTKYCQCCFSRINKIQISMTQNTKELQILGFGIPLYFAFIRNCIFLLIVTICSYNLASLYSSYKQNSSLCANLHQNHQLFQTNYFSSRHFQQQGQPSEKQQKQEGEKEKLGKEGEQKNEVLQCDTWMLFYSRIQKQIDLNEKLIRLSSFIIHMILLIYMRDKLVKIKQYFDQRLTSPSDYTLIVKNIPEQSTGTKNLLFRAFQSEFNIKKEQIPEIIIVPELKRFEQLEEQLKKNTQQLKQLVKNNKEAEIQKLEQELQLIQSQIIKQITFNKELYNSGHMKVKKAFVIINTQTQLERILKQVKKKGISNQQWKQMKIEKAPEPKEIIWQNFYISQRSKAWQTFLGWVKSILVLVVITIVFFFFSKKKSQVVEGLLQKFKQNRVENASYQIYSMLIVGVMIFFVVMFNKLIISTLFHIFTDQQRHSTSYKFQISFCLKYCLGLFFTTALMTLLVEAFFFHNYYQHEYGVIQQETIMYLVNSLFVPFFWLVNPIYLIRKYKQNKSRKQQYFTQAQANQIMQMPEYDVGKRYGQVLQVMWFTYLYMTLIPIGGVFSCIGLFLYYWIDKYNLLRRSTIKTNVSGDLIHLTLKMLDFTLVLRTGGQILFDFQIRNGISLSSWICFGLAVFYNLLPVDRIIRFFNKEKFDSAEKTYREALPRFTSSYFDDYILFAYLKTDRDNRLQKLNQKADKKSQLIS